MHMNSTAIIDNTLFVTDLDGTLLDDTSRVSPESLRLLNALTALGAHITVATARTPATVQPLLKGFSSTLPAIVMTGAAMWDRQAMRYLHPHLLPPQAARAAIAMCRANSINPFIYTLDTACDTMTVYHNGPTNPPEQQFIDQRRNLTLKHFELDTPAGLAPHIPHTAMIFAMGPFSSIDTVARALSSRDDCSVSAYVDIYSHDTGILEVFAPGVSKARAIARLARDTGLGRTVVFGDNLNDLPMMATATEAYAVANALPQVKQAATGIIGPNTAHAVPRAIASLCGIDHRFL